MKTFALLTVLTAWACLFLAPSGTLSKLLQLMVFGLLGAVFTLAGGFAWYWDSHMRPDQASSFLLVCGVLTLASQAATVLIAVLSTEGAMPWPDTPGRSRHLRRGNAREGSARPSQRPSADR